MFKGNISPMNTNKDNKYSHQNQNYIHQNSQNSHNESYGHGMGNANGNPMTPGGYQYSKFTYPVNSNGQAMLNNGNTGKHQIGSNINGTGNNYHNAPLSPNINKAPMSPTAKIKMFSNTLVANKKNVSSTNHLLQDNPHIPTKQPHTSKLIHTNNNNHSNSNKLLINNNKQHQQAFNLTDSIDLKCDQVLQQSDISTPISNYPNPRSPLQNLQKKQTGYNNNNNNIKKTKSNIPILNLQPDIQDDLKCDQVLDIVNRQHDNQSSRRNIKVNNNSNYPHGNNDENNFTYVNQIGNKENRYNGENEFKMNNNGNYAPLTPNYEKKKFSQIPLIMTKKNTSQRQLQPQPKNSSIKNLIHQKPSNNQQKIRSLSTNIHTQNPHPHPHHQNLRYQQNNEQSSQQKSLDLTQRLNPNINKMQKNIHQITQTFKQRTQKVLEQYRRKLEQAEQKIRLLEKQNGQLKKCVNGNVVGYENNNEQITIKRENSSNNMKNYSHFNHPIHGLISGGNGNMINGKNMNNIMGMK